jgi:hypothetical protein
MILVVKRHYSSGPRGLLNVLMLLVGLALVIGLWLQVARTLTSPVRLPPSTLRPTGIVWHHRVYSSEKELKAAYEASGSPYAAWARNHPGAVAILERRAPAPAAKAKQPKQAKQATPKAHAPAPTRAQATERRAAAAPASASTATAGGGTNAALVLAYALVTVLLLLALAPHRYLRPIHARLNDYRSYAAAVAIGLSAALLAAQLLP